MKRALGAAMLCALSGCGAVAQGDCSALPSFEDRMEAGKASLTATDPSARVFAAMSNADSCVAIAARRFAPGPDPAKDVAEAVTAECEQAILRVASAQADADTAAGGRGPLYDQVSGRQVNYSEWAFAKFGRAAKMRVAEARAGKCRPPR